MLIATLLIASHALIKVTNDDSRVLSIVLAQRGPKAIQPIKAFVEPLWLPTDHPNFKGQLAEMRSDLKFRNDARGLKQVDGVSNLVKNLTDETWSAPVSISELNLPAFVHVQKTPDYSDDPEVFRSFIRFYPVFYSNGMEFAVCSYVGTAYIHMYWERFLLKREGDKYRIIAKSSGMWL